MGVIDAINKVYFAATKPFDAVGNARFGTKLIRTGVEATARIDGIKTTHSESTSSQWVYILAVTVRPGAADEFRAGFQQEFPGPRERLHLGSVVPVRHDEARKRVVVEWPALRNQWGSPTSFDTPDGWRPVAQVPRDGIDDWSQKPPKGERHDATIVAVSFAGLFGGTDARPSLVLQLPDGRQVSRDRIDVPDYAFYLCAVGNVLPVGVNGDKVEFDWAAAADAYAKTPPRATFDYDADPR
jgi:hypothetical protein